MPFYYKEKDELTKLVRLIICELYRRIIDIDRKILEWVKKKYSNSQIKG